MKKMVFLSICLFVVSFATAQDFNKIANTQFKVVEDYDKAESDVLKAADFLFNTPAKPLTDNRAIAVRFVLNWMEGTAKYTFSLSSEMVKVTKEDPDLIGLYFAGLTKIALDNPDQKFTDDEMHEKTTQLLAVYCSKKENKLKPTKALKKIIRKMKKS